MRFGLLVGIVGAAAVPTGGCTDSCIEPGYARMARGSSDYVMSAGADRGGDASGLGPSTITLRDYRPFDDGACDTSGSFSIELEPSCVIGAFVTSHEHDTGKYSSKDFLQSQAQLKAGSSCALSLDGGRRVSGIVESGSIVILPSGMEVTVLISVWEPEQRKSSRVRLRFDGSWI